LAFLSVSAEVAELLNGALAAAHESLTDVVVAPAPGIEVPLGGSSETAKTLVVFVQCMSRLLAHRDRYCVATECLLLGA
jgi:hypothetical protein